MAGVLNTLHFHVESSSVSSLLRPKVTTRSLEAVTVGPVGRYLCVICVCWNMMRIPSSLLPALNIKHRTLKGYDGTNESDLNECTPTCVL